MIRQASAWGQFWFDLSALHRVHGCAIYTPLWGGERPLHRGLYHSTWFRWVNGGPIYYQVDGDTMIEMLRDGLIKTGCYNLRMKIALLAVLTDQINYSLERLP